MASGGQARDQLYDELVALTGGAAAFPVHLIGDAYAPRTLLAAMHDGARAGRAI